MILANDAILKGRYSVILWATLCAAIGGSAIAEEKKQGFFESGKADVSLRYRFAYVDQDGLANSAKASTLQTMLGYRTGTVGGFSGYFQVRNVTNIGAENYNNTLNGKTTYPVVADPESTEVDQAYLKYSTGKNLSITVGRRKLKWDNQRFISALGWRQNNRSFDSVVVEGANDANTLQAKYAYAWNVNRAFTDRSAVGNFDSNIHLFNTGYSGFSLGKLSAYAYLVDQNDAFALGLATKTFGASFGGKKAMSDSAKILYFAEYAKQSDYADNPGDFSETYFRGEAGVSFSSGLTVKAGYEKLGGNGVSSFKTPLALLHAFNGWVDKFVVTPPNGLTDKHVKASMKFKNQSGFLKGTTLNMAYHDFDSDTGNISYGSEFDIALIRKFAKRFTVIVKGAFYNADQFSTDTKKIWFVLATKF